MPPAKRFEHPLPLLLAVFLSHVRAAVYLEGPIAILQFCERLLYAQLAGSRLDLSQLQLTEIHIPVERCVVSASLTMLNLDANCFVEVPACMAQFTSLQASLCEFFCRSLFRFSLRITYCCLLSNRAHKV